MAETYDLIIIGSGPAGLTAAIYAARAKLKTIVIGKLEDSGLHYSSGVENYPPFVTPIAGQQWLKQAVMQAKKYGAEVFSDKVVNLVMQGSNFKIKTDSGKDFEGKTIIIATGKSPSYAGITNERELLGKGVHLCVACDGYFYKNKKVAIIGNTNYAGEEAAELLAHTKDITIISNGQEWKLSNEMKSFLEKNGVKFSEEVITEFEGAGVLQDLVTIDGNKLKFDGVFEAIGYANALSFANKLGLQMNGEEIVIDRDGKTFLDNVYAAGFATGGNNQIPKSIGEGCNAAIAIIKKLKNVDIYLDQT